MLAGNGRLPHLQLVEAISGVDGKWIVQPIDSASPSIPVISAETAAAARAGWPETSGVLEFPVTVLSGPSGHRNSWFLGMAPAASPRFVVALVLEDESNLSVAEHIGQRILNLATEP